MINRRTGFTALALMLVLAAAAEAQRSTIRGKVRTPSGTPVNNAIVELRLGGGGMLAQTVTRNDGDFAFSGLDPAEYEVAVIMAGFQPTAQMVRFDNDAGMRLMQFVNVEIVIRPKPDAAPSVPTTLFAQDVPKVARAAYERAIIKLREGRATEAAELLRAAIAEFSDYFDAHYMLGQELFRAGQDREALEELERARQINDRQDAVYHLFGLIMFKEKKYALAQRAFREAETLKPANPLPHFHRGVALIELAIREDNPQREADFGDAEHELNRAWELSDQRMNEVRLQRARVYERRGNKEAAAHELEAYLKSEPEARNAATVREALAKLRSKKSDK
ncbi:MAG: carboxypeptidase regulatory-like domain-containing protein [Blastocatellia bacterium]